MSRFDRYPIERQNGKSFPSPHYHGRYSLAAYFYLLFNSTVRNSINALDPKKKRKTSFKCSLHYFKRPFLNMKESDTLLSSEFRSRGRIFSKLLFDRRGPDSVMAKNQSWTTSACRAYLECVDDGITKCTAKVQSDKSRWVCDGGRKSLVMSRKWRYRLICYQPIGDDVTKMKQAIKMSGFHVVCLLSMLMRMPPTSTLWTGLDDERKTLSVSACVLEQVGIPGWGQQLHVTVDPVQR